MTAPVVIDDRRVGVSGMPPLEVSHRWRHGDKCNLHQDDAIVHARDCNTRTGPAPQADHCSSHATYERRFNPKRRELSVSVACGLCPNSPL